jgi:2-polyprenyl-3-methyl-5-hydroxy-6-metoxy-1,4-benzoquinol methylase
MTDFKVLNSEGLEVLAGDLPKINGVYHLLTSSEFEDLKKHFEGFIRYRKEKNELEQDPNVIQNLPYSKNDNAWKNKQYTLEILNRHILKEKPKNVLIIGAGNGWLCNKIALQGIDCLGTDILYYRYDGLETIDAYSSKFTHLLMHPHEIDRLKSKFDLIVFENNLPYIKDYVQVIQNAKKLLTPQGSIFLVGVSIHLNGINKEVKRISRMQEYFRKNYNHEINTYQTKMFLSDEILEEFKNLNFKVYFRPQFKNRIKRLLRHSVVNCDAIYTNKEIH